MCSREHAGEGYRLHSLGPLNGDGVLREKTLEVSLLDLTGPLAYQVPVHGIAYLVQSGGPTRVQRVEARDVEPERGRHRSAPLAQGKLDELRGELFSENTPEVTLRHVPMDRRKHERIPDRLGIRMGFRFRS